MDVKEGVDPESFLNYQISEVAECFYDNLMKCDSGVYNRLTVENEDDVEFILASTYIEDAIEGRHMEFTHTKQGLKIYQLYKMPIFRYLLFTLLVVDVLLALVETPCKSGWEVPYWATLCIGMLKKY